MSSRWRSPVGHNVVATDRAPDAVPGPQEHRDRLRVRALDVTDPASAYGLSSGIWNSDPDRVLAAAPSAAHRHRHAERIADQLRRPFGGYMASGLGREYGKAGLTGYVEHKWISRTR
ncbi:aldehyde dehydrogenase family protein [Streptomyces sp. NPDC052492]|uniref:aldehyde dehydrogenase family protein n=1 Tax=Streptomyces sp. NPDC052492 TaxID=3365691 RepID=UPI0037D64EFE